MKIRAKTLTLLLSGVACFAGTNAFADDAANNAPNTQNVDALIKKINAQEKSLEAEVASLKTQVKTLKSQQQQNTKKITVAQTKLAVNEQKGSTQAHNILSLGPSPVVIAPYIGVKPRYDALDLIVNQPTYNEDVILMQRDRALDREYKKKGYGDANSQPVLELSGKVEGVATEAKPFAGNNQSDIDLASSELDFIGHISKWINGIMTIKYNGNPPNATSTNSAERVSNTTSSIYLDHAFITVGNLGISPLYATIGQRVLPFGHYGTAMIDLMYNDTLFKSRQRSLLFGYQPMNDQGLYGSAFVFKGDTKVGGGASNINNYGFDSGVLFNKGIFSGDVGVSGIANVADAQGMQKTGVGDNTQFRGFGYSPVVNGVATSNQENLQRRVPGADVHMAVNIGNYSIVGEFTGATSRFNAQDLTFNGHGAKPAAAHGELVYNFNIGRYPSNIAVGYDHTWQALGLAIPQARYIATLNTSVFKNTIAAFQLKHEINYAAGDTATGQQATVVIPGHSSNTGTFQFGFYF